MKKFALRGLLALFALVLCAMFFAQTLMTITTPRVSLTMVRSGRLEETVALTGTVHFEKTQAYTPKALIGQTAAVRRVLVRPGDWVALGQPLAEIDPPAGFETRLSAAREKVLQARQAFRQNEIDHIALSKTMDTDKNGVVREAETALTDWMDAQAALLREAASKGVLLGEDPESWALAIGGGGDATLAALLENVETAQALLEQSEARVKEVFLSSRIQEDLYNYIEKRTVLQSATLAAQADWIALLLQTEQAKTLRAARAGYLTALGVAEGKPYEAATPAYSISVDCEPVLLCKADGTTRELAVGMQAFLRHNAEELQTTVLSVTNHGSRAREAAIALPPESLAKMGGLPMLLTQTVQAAVVYKADQATSLLPASAVRSEGEHGDYVYVAEQKNTFFGTALTLRKRQVTVLERSMTEVSLKDNLSGVQVAHLEDRFLEDGATVMEYTD